MKNTGVGELERWQKEGKMAAGRGGSIMSSREESKQNPPARLDK
jgi:hypothetical protein